MKNVNNKDILVLSIIPQPITPASQVNLCQSFDESFSLLFGGTIDKTLIRYHHNILALKTGQMLELVQVLNALKSLKYQFDTTSLWSDSNFRGYLNMLECSLKMNYPAAELRSIKMNFYLINPDAEHRGILLIKKRMKHTISIV